MRRKKKTIIATVESRERLTIRHSARQLIAWCERCRADVLVVTPNEAAVIAQVDVPAILRQVELGATHLIEKEGGALICVNSLRTSGQQKEARQ
jgi:hypothetical protein